MDGAAEPLPLASEPTDRPGSSSRSPHNQQQLRDVSSKTPMALKGAARDSKFRRSPSRLARDGERGVGVGGGGTGSGVAKPKKTRLSPNLPRSLLPVTERKTQDDVSPKEVKGRPRRDTGSDKWEIAPDGGSAGREGRQFAVANVGHNGRIYLRPTVRPAHQRYPQPNFVFPITPPGTAGLDSLAAEKGKPEQASDQSRLLSGRWTPSQAPSTPSATQQRPVLGERPFTRSGHRRALSDTTIPDTSVARESDPGGFKIVITHPGEEQRPRTLEDIDLNSAPILDVSIPSWRLGTPRFSMRGTPFIRGSSYAPTEELRSSNASLLHQSWAHMFSQSSSPGSKRPSPAFVSHVRLSQIHLAAQSSTRTPRLPLPLSSAYMSPHSVIEPDMFDALTFKPACDDRSLVRYSSASGAVTAATPPRLVAEITSPSFLDYELISDFFLTFRAFLDPTALLKMLIARLRWALARNDETGMVVRVRTFVALRHWILNYFMDDFVVDYDLRVAFCGLLNEFYDELAKDQLGLKVQFKILSELKKCWRRVCAHYWDGPDFDASLGPEKPIKPGGIAGHRDPNLDPSFWDHLDSPPQLEDIVAHMRAHYGFEAPSLYTDGSKGGRRESTGLTDRPGTPENPHRPVEQLERNQTSPTSITSVDVISCSFPTRNLRLGNSAGNHPLAVHPVDSTAFYADSDPVATTPRALVGKRVRAQTTRHKRNGSLTDSLRDHASSTDKVAYKSAEFLMAMPYAGSLVRGNILPPGQAFVEVLPATTPGALSRQTTVFQPRHTESPRARDPASAMSGQGMRRLLGSVRRALSTRGQIMSPSHGGFLNMSPIGPRGATINRLPGTAIVPQARPPQNGIRPPVRIDVLGAEIAEDFKQAIREGSGVGAERYSHSLPTPSTERASGCIPEYSAAHMDTTTLTVPPLSEPRPVSDAAITTGSKSIVIVDDTLQPEYPSAAMMTGALPVANSSVEALTEIYVPSCADPTPPTTPPGNTVGTPRISSYALSQPAQRPSLSVDPLPPFVPDLDTLTGPQVSEDAARPSVDIIRPAVEFSPEVRSRPPLSYIRGHRRNRSSRSYRSNRSSGRGRFASFTSGMIPRSTIRSFDATTFSEGSVMDGISDVSIPQPLRVLRRRPGGDLRAAKNIVDLEHGPLRKSRSAGSLTAYSESMRSSFVRSPVQESSGFVDVVNSDYSQDRADTFSLGALAEKKPARNLSLFSTHSSKPIMRPSFEVEAQKLAQIPDDLDDDGGVESALLKLEGKYEKRAPRLSLELRELDASEPHPDDPDASDVRQEKKEHRQKHIGGEEFGHASSPTADEGEEQHGSFLADPSAEDQASSQEHHTHLTPPRLARKKPGVDLHSFLSAASSGESYSSTPLLDRELTDDGRSKRDSREWTNLSVLQDPDEEMPAPVRTRQSLVDSQHPSYDFVKKTQSLERIPPGETMPPNMRESVEQFSDLSFLEDESDRNSDLSSEMSAELMDEKLEQAGLSHLSADTVISPLPSHPPGDLPKIQPVNQTGQQAEEQPIPTQKASEEALEILSPDPSNVPQLHEDQIWGEKPLPPTPDLTPTPQMYAKFPTFKQDPIGSTEALRNISRHDFSRKGSVHLPFILAFESDVLAQQFTLIEKDALNEIDWKELIDMRWKNAENSDSRSWVEFLRSTDARGVEVVIARFNIMVKWTVSEIVLTQDVVERAQCVIKFIHVAAQCRKYRNYATMSQITMALSSNEVSRLAKTWAMIPESDIKTLRDLENLVSPTRNFYNLRAEMEAVGIASADTGCIPFVGIYTHDLLFNAQRPSEIASSPTTLPLVNFERCRIAAAVVKTLLRLLEASTLYDFQPIEGITERCLWMRALSDEEIRKHSEALE